MLLKVLAERQGHFIQCTSSHCPYSFVPMLTDVDFTHSVMLRLVSEVPVNEDTLMWVLLMGLSRDHHINPSDAIDLADQLVRRAASLHPDNFPVLQMKRLEIIDVVLNLCAYRHPENIALPKGYQPPSPGYIKPVLEILDHLASHIGI